MQKAQAFRLGLHVEANTALYLLCSIKHHNRFVYLVTRVCCDFSISRCAALNAAKLPTFTASMNAV